MNRKLHTNTNIFFQNPHVYIVDHEDFNPINLRTSTLYKNLKKKLYNTVENTWGYTQPLYNFDKAGISMEHSFWCFSNELDVLKFKLLIDKSRRAYMWPVSSFTIFEFTE